MAWEFQSRIVAAGWWQLPQVRDRSRRCRCCSGVKDIVHSKIKGGRVGAEGQEGGPGTFASCPCSGLPPVATDLRSNSHAIGHTH